MLRPRSSLEAMDLGVAFLRREIRTFLPIAGVVLLPALGLAYLADRLHAGPYAAGALFFLLPLLELPFTVAASQLVFRKDVRVRDVLAASGRLLPSTFALRLFDGIVQAAAAAAFLVPAFFTALATFFLLEVAVLEGGTLRGSVQRARRLGFAATNEALGGLLLLATLRAVVFALGDVAGRAVLSSGLSLRAPVSLFSEGSWALALAATILAVPFFAVGRFLLYLSVRTTLEGWDLQTRFLAARDAAVEAP